MKDPRPSTTAGTPTHILIKPAGPDCNLSCEYCFYSEKQALFPGKKTHQMPDIVLQRLILSYLNSQPTREVEFAWQGGEPTLVGLDFFRRAIELQKQKGAGRVITNTIQTNGILLNNEWCEFLAKEKILVGISIDGPEPIHNRYRVYTDGSGSFQHVMQAVKCMQKHGVEFNSLTCITRESAAEGRQVYRFLREIGVKFMQFIPIVERLPDSAAEKLGLTLGSPPDLTTSETSPAVMPFTVEPTAYGQFLIDIFDEWIKRDVGRIFVNHFDVALSAWAGAMPSLCVNAKTCGTAMAIEHDGSVYACDHFVYPGYLRGNLMTADLSHLVGCIEQRGFGLQKELGLTEDCKHCRHLHACNGGCPKHRFMKSPSGLPGHNFLCAGYQRFYDHIAPAMEQMAALLRQRRPASDIMKQAASPVRGRR